MNVFLDALSDAWGQMTGTLAFVAQAFGENWRTGLAALLDRPTALFYVVGVVAVLVLAFSGLTVGSRIGYQRGRFLSANEKSFLRTLDAALGRNYRAFAQVRLAELANPADSANVAPSPPGPQRRHGEERRLRGLRRPHSRSGRRDRGR